jgi:hypothetical protein
VAVRNESVEFGSSVQHVAADVSGCRNGVEDGLGVALSGLVSGKEVDCLLVIHVDSIQHLVEGCVLLTGSSLRTPRVRNSFVIRR